MSAKVEKFKFDLRHALGEIERACICFEASNPTDAEELEAAEFYDRYVRVVEDNWIQIGDAATGVVTLLRGEKLR
jgi:hypothetical protein